MKLFVNSEEFTDIFFKIHINKSFTSSETALMLVNPFLNTTYTLLAPHVRADVAQSKAVSHAPSTIILPDSWGSLNLQLHIPVQRT